MFNLETAEANRSYDENGSHRHSRCSSLNDQTVLWIGVSIACSASIGLMMTFCPESREGMIRNDETNSSSCCCCSENKRVRPLPYQNEDVNEPLLVNDQLVFEENIETQGNNTTNIGTSADIAENPEEATSSRIRGTTRLLKLAGDQSMYLWLGIAVLLIRLPFSLSIPNFVSAVIGDLIDADYDGAKRNVLILFLLGSVDSVLDFWW